MAKLIHTPVECGYKHYNMCLYGQKPGTCIPKDHHNFPDNCPLEDGMSLERNSEKASLSFLMRESNNNIRRTRKQCVFFLNGTQSKNNCTCGYFKIVGSMVYPKCKGVNCGHFAKPVKWK